MLIKLIRLKEIIKQTENLFLEVAGVYHFNPQAKLGQDDLSHPFKSEDKILWCCGTHALAYPHLTLWQPFE